MSYSDCCQLLLKGIRLCLWLTIWPILSIVLGIIFGVPVGLIVAIGVVIFTILWTPLHIIKTLYVTATERECFQGRCCLGPVLRVMVFLLAPIPHILFLMFVTIVLFTIGIMYYIGRTSRVIYKLEFDKARNDFGKFVRLDRNTKVGQYYSHCQEYMKQDDDEICHAIIYTLKRLSSFIIGAPLGALPFLPLSIAVMGISVARLPINMAKTMKIVYCTVLLEWDLRLLAIVSLPVVHTIFPLVAFICAVIGSFFFFIFQTSDSIYNGDSPFHGWGEIKEWISNYHKWHVDFVSDIDVYDHPSGIPNGWRGSSYGLPIRRILWLQWDFLVCCFLVIYSLPISVVGSIVLAAIKVFPSCIYGWYKASKEYCKQATVNMIATWPFFVAFMLLLVPLLVLFFYVGLIISCVLYAAIYTPIVYIGEGYLPGLYRPFWCLGDIDEWSDKLFGKQEYYIYSFWQGEPSWDSEETAWRRRRRRQRMVNNSRYDPERLDHRAYWDRFTSQCVSTTAGLLRDDWVTLESIQDVDPAAVQTVPAVAILSVLVDSVNEPGLTTSDFKWSIDGSVCKSQEYKESLDGIVVHLMPLIMDIRSLLSRKKKTLCTHENVQQIRALLCSNTENDTETLQSFQCKTRDEQTKKTQKDNYDKNNLIRTKINGLVLALLRVKPYQERMNTIFSYNYAVEVSELGVCRAKNQQDQEGWTEAVVNGDDEE